MGFCTFAFPRYTSKRHERMEKVKKDTPRGMDAWGAENPVFSRALTFSSRKPKYLKKPSSRRSAATAEIRVRFRSFGCFWPWSCKADR